MFCQPMKWQWRCLRKSHRLLTYLPEDTLPLSINPIPAFCLVYFTECCNTGLFKLFWYKLHFPLFKHLFSNTNKLFGHLLKVRVFLLSLLHFSRFWRQSRISKSKVPLFAFQWGVGRGVLDTFPFLTLHFLYMIVCILVICCPGYFQEKWIRYSGWVSWV